MNCWAHMFADTPPTEQRLIARMQRISLPRQCSAAERVLRLRHALCHAATVRATYATLDVATQQAHSSSPLQRSGGDLQRTAYAVRIYTLLGDR